MGISKKFAAIKFDHLFSLPFFIAICLGLFLIQYGESIFCGKEFYASDHQLYFAPLARFIGKAISHWQLPLWNPYIHCGISQIAVPSPGVFYPPNWLFAFLPYGIAIAWLMILHQLVAAMGSYLLISSFNWGKPAGIVAGIIAAFSGYMFSLTSNYTLVAVVAWLPISLWLFRLIAICPTQKEIYLPVALASLSIFLMICAGRPEVFVPALALVILFILLQVLTNKSEQIISQRARLAWMLLALLNGTLLAMVSLLPTLEWFRHSPRANGLGIEHVLLWSANWYDLVSTIFAQPLGDFTEIGTPYLNTATSRFGFVPFLPSPLVGPVAITLAIIGICDNRWRYRYIVFSIFIVALCITIGQNIYLLPNIMAHIPYANIFRYPIKLIIFPILCIALAAGRGIYYLSSENPPKKSLLITAVIWLLLLLFGTCLSLFGILSKPLPIAVLKLSGAQLLLGQAILRGALLGLATCLCAYFLPRYQKVCTLSLIVLLIVSLFVPAYYYRSKNLAKDYYNQKPFLLTEIAKLSADNAQKRILPIYFDPLKAPANDFPGDPNAKSFNYFRYYHNLLLPNTNVDWLRSETFGYETSETQDFRQLFIDALHNAQPKDASTPDFFPLWKFCQSTGTGWLCTQINGKKGELPIADENCFSLAKEIPSMNLRIYQVNDFLPRAFVSKSWQWADSHKDALDMISHPMRFDFDPENQTIIESLPNNSRSYAVPLPNKEQNNVDNQIVYTQQGNYRLAANAPPIPTQPPLFLKDFPEHISISVSVDKSTFLVLSDQFYPGWTAHIDSVETPIFRANGVFKAVYVPRGGHLIQFDYEPESLFQGLCLAALGALIVIALLLKAAAPNMWQCLKQMSGQT